LSYLDGEDDIHSDRVNYVDTAHFSEKGAAKVTHQVIQLLLLSDGLIN
jgi:hypothetical protein